ncbi:MAG: prepilin-type N-terminal cleavage/methylation domain-containing protein [Campylobacterota bacterium]|nr:prepilin-type N-terminal cleavage/methylation domain-containing protein [Campylobacterota bacterium]
MSKAFTLIELIFVIILIGIIAGVGSSMFKTNYLLNDTQYIMSKIHQAQYEGIGYEHQNFDGTFISDNRGCITFTKEKLDDNASVSGGKYSLHVSINHSSLTSDTICFDAKGRPHDGDFTQGSLLKEQKVLKLIYSNQTNQIIIEPITGYAIIKYN